MHSRREFDRPWLPVLGSEQKPATSCLELLTEGHTSDAMYWIDLTGGDPSDAMQIFCDQTTDGGGWALVYQYEFVSKSANLNAFAANSNAVTPQAAWTGSLTSTFEEQFRQQYVQKLTNIVNQLGNITGFTTTVKLYNVSTTQETVGMQSSTSYVSGASPSSHTDTNAVPYHLWGAFGSQFLVKSDINDWVLCDEEGSQGKIITGPTPGAISCWNIKSQGLSCQNRVPTHVGVATGGFTPCLTKNSGGGCSDDVMYS
jgi:hypothetical protein